MTGDRLVFGQDFSRADKRFVPVTQESLSPVLGMWMCFRVNYQLLYAVPSLEFCSLPLCTSMIPGCDWSGDMMLSSVTGTQLSRVFVKGSLGSSFRYPASTRSCSDCGAFCLSNVY